MELPSLNLIIPDSSVGPNLQAAVNQAKGFSPQSVKSAVWIPATYAGIDTYTNPSNVPIFDMRGSGSISFGGGGGGDVSLTPSADQTITGPYALILSDTGSTLETRGIINPGVAPDDPSIPPDFQYFLPPTATFQSYSQSDDISAGSPAGIGSVFYSPSHAGIAGDFVGVSRGGHGVEGVGCWGQAFGYGTGTGAKGVMGAASIYNDLPGGSGGTTPSAGGDIMAFFAFTGYVDPESSATKNVGYWSQSQAGVSGTLNAAFYAEDQGTGTNDYAIYIAGGKSQLDILRVSGDIAFFGGTPAAKPTVTGAKLPSDVALASLLTALSGLGLLTDSTS